MYRYSVLEQADPVSYGILAETAEGPGWRPAARVLDISPDKEFVSDLARRCTSGQLSPLHLLDVVLDALP